MKAAGLRGISRRRFVTTMVGDGARRAPDLVDRNFVATAPNVLWVADITHVPTWSGFLYLAIVLALRQAQGEGVQPARGRLVDVDDVADRAGAGGARHGPRVRKPRGVIHQSAQYTSLAFGRRCRESGVRPSMGAVGDAYDNAMTESFLATLECELLAHHQFKTLAEAHTAIFQFVEGFYNPRRRHSALGYLSPARVRTPAGSRGGVVARHAEVCRRARDRQG